MYIDIEDCCEDIRGKRKIIRLHRLIKAYLYAMRPFSEIEERSLYSSLQNNIIEKAKLLRELESLFDNKSSIVAGRARIFRMMLIDDREVDDLALYHISEILSQAGYSEEFIIAPLNDDLR